MTSRGTDEDFMAGTHALIVGLVREVVLLREQVKSLKNWRHDVEAGRDDD